MSSRRADNFHGRTDQGKATQYRKGQFVPGRSPNPGGKTKATLAIQRLQHELIAEMTDGGREIIAFAVKVFQGKQKDCADSKSRRWAADFLADRLWGRAPITVTIKPAKRVEIDDLKKMSLDELERYAADGPPALPEPGPELEEPVDVPTSDVH